MDSLSGPSLSILPGLAGLPRLPLFIAAFFEHEVTKVGMYNIMRHSLHNLLNVKSNLQCLKKKLNCFLNQFNFHQ
jgi:hypothetical protein